MDRSLLIRGLLDEPLALEDLLDEVPLGLALLDPEHRLVFMNRALEALCGVNRSEVKGTPCAHILRSRLCINGCPAIGRSPGGEPVCAETDLITRQRERVPVRVSLGALAGKGGRIAGFLETVEDLRGIQAEAEKGGVAYGFGEIVGKSPEMEKIFRMLPAIAGSDSSVLITGETGTGKDLVAEAVHRASERARGPFIKVNCGALPEALLESELFGHRKGAFTGAVESKPGRFRMAHNGTIYLTEIGDLPLALQVKLLTFLDDQVVYPLGSSRGFQTNVRIIAATHRDLAMMVQYGKFREDLLFRLNVVRIHLPPLRERGEDIRLLLDHFRAVFAERSGKDIRGFSKGALEFLGGYYYPGNVRELRNIVEYAVTICPGGEIRKSHLPAYLFEERTDEGAGDSARTVPPFPVLGSEQPHGEESWAAMERKMILDALMRSRGRRGKAAELLGWGRSTLWRKMKHYGIDT
ncbi:MAG: sigma-54 interaction domain-containing protein [Desulfobacteraceae bacterium]